MYDPELEMARRIYQKNPRYCPECKCEIPTAWNKCHLCALFPRFVAWLSKNYGMGVK